MDVLIEEFKKLRNSMESNKDEKHLIFLLLDLTAWKKLSEEKKVEKNLAFEEFIKQGKSKEEFLLNIANYLSEKHKILSREVKRLISKLPNEIFIRLINIIKNLKEYPIVDKVLNSDTIIRLFHRDVISYPQEIVELLLGILRNEKFSEVYNPYPGLYRFAYHLSKKFNIPVYTEDFIPSSIPYLMNIINNVQIEPSFSNPLKNPSFKKGYTLKTFDISVSFLPINLRGEVPKDIYGRFKVSREGRKNSLDVANIEHILAQTKNKAIIFVSPGLLSRSIGNETELRKLLVDSGALEAVILLPENLLPNTFISIAVLIINKTKQTKEVLFIDASNLYEKASVGRKNVLKDIKKIVNTYLDRIEVEGFSSLVSGEEIKQKGYSLNPKNYVKSKEDREIEELLNKFKKITLSEVAQIIHSPMVRRKEGNIEVYEVQISDIPESGVLEKVELKKKVDLDEKQLKDFSIKEHDVLLSTKGTTGKVGIILEKPKNQIWIPGQTITILRTKDKEDAIVLYMFLRSRVGQKILSNLKTGGTIGNIPSRALRDLRIPLFKEDQRRSLIEAFEKEREIYEEIKRLETEVENLKENVISNLV